jgi:tRNA threonylcarbamoyladenosine biosynthesis protein TsaB
MILSIDTSNAEKIIVGIDDKRFTTNAKKEKSQKLLPFIDETLKKNKLAHSDITEIKVNTGPGSFTGLRIGVSVANAIGWSLGIPVNGKSIKNGESVRIIYD